MPREKMRLVPLGINMRGLLRRVRAQPQRGRSRSATSRAIAPEKGLHVLARGLPAAAAASGHRGDRGWSPPGTCRPSIRAISNDIRSDVMRRAGASRASSSIAGEVDRAAKMAFLQEPRRLSVPTTYEEPKGMFLLEAMATGVPVVQPRRGAFPEIVENTGGGVIVEPDDPDALADGFLDALAATRARPRARRRRRGGRARALHRRTHGRSGRGGLPGRLPGIHA